MPKRKAVFLDRDGVINKAVIKNGFPCAPTSSEQFEILPDVKSSLNALSEAGFFLIVITNQPDVARGLVEIRVIEQMHKNIKSELKIDVIKVCFHDDLDGCHCRKPKPGLIFDAAREFEVDLSESFVIGDRWRDIDAGLAAGCKTIFIDNGYLEKKPRGFLFSCESLWRATEWILSSPNY
jgi:D-glycero-D-manno-heptose 1,7-bisphosphate phosphatase